MSNLFTHTPQNSTIANQVELLANEVNSAFVALEDLIQIGEQYQAGFSSSIGNLDTGYLKDYLADNGKIIGYVQNLIFPVNSKEASLELTPSTDITDLNSVVITNTGSPIVYTYKHDGILVADTDFTFINKKLIMKVEPSNSLYITYTGYPYRPDSSMLYYNLLKVNESTEHTYTQVGNVYTVIGADFRSLCSPFIKSLIDNSEDLAPYAAIFTDGIKLTTTNITISSSSVSFTTTDIVGQEVQIYVANTSIGDLLASLYKLMYTHNHSTTEGSNVNHRDLLGLFTNTSTIEYMVSSKENYEHPQYFNREGYIVDPTVYNNAILGDLLLGSNDSSNYYNNLDDDSKGILFGSYSSGHKLYYNATTNAVTLDSGEDKNGLHVKAAYNKQILKLNTHIVSDIKTILDVNYLELLLAPSQNNSNGILKIKSQSIDPFTLEVTAVDTAQLYINHINTATLDISEELKLSTNAKLSFGSPVLYNVKLNSTNSALEFMTPSANTTGYSVDFKVPTKHIESTIDKLYAKDSVLNAETKISFGDLGSIRYIGNYLTTTSKYASNYRSNGYRTGFTLDKRSWQYVSTTLGEELLEASIGNTDLYLETPLNGEVYFLENTESAVTVGITDLRDLPKATLNYKNSYQDQLYINYVSSKINGINLDTIDNNKIFAGKDAQSNVSTLLKTNGKVIIASGYVPSGSGTPTITYGTLLANKLETSGDGTTDSGYYGNVVIPLGYKLNIFGTVTFGSDITFTSKVTMEDTLTAPKIIVNEIEAKYIDVLEELSAKRILADEDETSRVGKLEVRKTLEVSQAINQNSSTANNVFNGTLKVVGKSEFLSGLDLHSSIIEGVTNSDSPSGDEGVSYSLLKYEQSQLEDTLNTTIDTKVTAALDSFLERIFPVGTLYFNETTESDPYTLLNFGVWNRTLEGRSPMGLIKSSYLATDPTIPDRVKSGIGVDIGEYEHAMTSDENGPHNHQGTAFGSTSAEYKSGAGGYWNHDSLDHPGSPTTGFSGLGTPHNTIHPVTIVSIWKRVA